jgi:two-component system response regulator MprA
MRASTYMSDGISKPSILIVDDERSVRNALHRWFDACGYLVDVAMDGVEAVEKCTSKVFDAVIMDLEMPRMNGGEALSAIKVLQPELPVIVFTGYPHSQERAVYTGAARVLTKPLRLRDLEHEVRAVMELSGQSSS